VEINSNSGLKTTHLDSKLKDPSNGLNELIWVEFGLGFRFDCHWFDSSSLPWPLLLLLARTSQAPGVHRKPDQLLLAASTASHCRASFPPPLTLARSNRGPWFGFDYRQTLLLPPLLSLTPLSPTPPLALALRLGFQGLGFPCWRWWGMKKKRTGRAGKDEEGGRGFGSLKPGKQRSPPSPLYFYFFLFLLF